MLKGRLMFVVVSVLGAGIWFWMYTNNFLVDLDTRLQDKLFIPRAASSQIVLVTIDNESIQELGVWPFPRSLHAEAIEFITSDDPKIIGYDVTFSEASTPLEDVRLSEALASSGLVILASEAVLEIRDQDLPLAVTTLEPLAEFAQAAKGVGPTTLIPDGDGVIREVPTAYVRKGSEIAESFALILAAATEPGSLEKQSELLRVAYVGGPGSYSQVSFAEVVRGDVPAGTFTGKTVLVGATAPDLHDEYLTPFGAGQATPGVEIQANIVQSLLEGRDVRTFALQHIAILFGVLVVIGIILGLALRLRYLSAAAFLMVVGYLIVAVGLAGNDILLPIVHPLLLIVGIFGVDLLYRYRDEYARRSFIQSAFSRYVAPAVVEKLASGEAALELGGVKEELTILFSDIRGFTSLSEKMAPEELVTLLNEYLTGMTDVVLEHEGTVDKYIGDAIMAFWGAPLPQADHAVRGVSVAVAMKERLASLNDVWEAVGQPRLEIGIGLNTGKVIVGNMGSQRRFDYTVIGDDVNLASRLESLTKFYGVSILISEATLSQLGDRFLTRRLDRVAVKGKKAAVKIFEVVADNQRATDEQQDFVDAFEVAMTSYYAGEWQIALKQFKQFPQDKTAKLFVERCEEYLAKAPGKDWDGVYIAKEK
jgi:adenylate cyclase